MSELDTENAAAARVPSQAGEVLGDKVVEHDAVFGAITEDGPNYRNVGWIGTTALMMKTQIGLGVLSMPVVFDTLGMMPGVILLIVIAGITTWADYVVGVFKMRHRHVYGIDDVGRMLFGRVGYEVFGAMYALCELSCLVLAFLRYSSLTCQFLLSSLALLC